MARPTDRTSRRSSILGPRCAKQFRRAAEILDRKTRTDHGLHKPDKLTCYLQPFFGHMIAGHEVDKPRPLAYSVLPGEERDSSNVSTNAAGSLHLHRTPFPF